MEGQWPSCEEQITEWVSTVRQPGTLHATATNQATDRTLVWKGLWARGSALPELCGAVAVRPPALGEIVVVLSCVVD